MLSDNRLIVGVIGFGAFVIGGLMARQSAIEGLELFDETVDKYVKRNNPPAPQEAELQSE